MSIPGDEIEVVVKTPKPMTQNKPPVKTWSECASEGLNSSAQSVTSKASFIGNNNSSNSNNFLSYSSSTSKTSSRPPSRPMSAISTLEEEFEELELKMDLDGEFLERPLTMIRSRPIINPGNRCYMISVLQVLLHSKPFTNYMVKYFFKLDKVDQLLGTGKFPLLSGLKLFYEQFTVGSGSLDGAAAAVSYESIDMIFMALQGKMGSFSGAGFSDQEDAEEFLTSFLDAIGEEFTALKQGSSGSSAYLQYSLPFETMTTSRTRARTPNAEDDGGEWLQKVGPKQKIATTRRTPLSQTPIHLLFAGNFSSVYKCLNARPSITFEPFTVLSLEIVNERGVGIESIPAALNHLIRCEELRESSSASGSGSKATKQLSFSTLPPLLILQLKRFVYRQDEKTGEYDLHKITRPIKITPGLELDLNRGGYVSNTSVNYNKNTSTNRNHSNTSTSTSTSTSNMTRYQLYSIVNHHGSSLHGGHYTSHVLHQNDWLTFDDEQAVQLTKEETVLSLKNSTSAYLLFYQRK